MDVFLIAKSNDRDNFLPLFSRLLDRRYQIWFYSIGVVLPFFGSLSLDRSYENVLMNLKKIRFYWNFLRGIFLHEKYDCNNFNGFTLSLSLTFIKLFPGIFTSFFQHKEVPACGIPA